MRINISGILYLFGYILSLLSVATIIPILTALAYGESTQTRVFLTFAMLIALFAGGLLFSLRNNDLKLGVADFLFLMLVSWTLLPLLASIPMYVGHPTALYSAVLFDAVSGLTTSGGTTWSSLEVVPRSEIIWRSFLEWFGGGLFLLTIIVVLAPSEIGGVPERPLFLVESGATDGVARVKVAFFQVFPIYLLATMICYILLSLAGLKFLDALSISFSTLSTGGFMPIDGSLTHYDSVFVELTVGIFMLIGASSIIWLYLVFTKRWQHVFKYREGAWFIVFFIATGIAFANGFYQGYDGPSGLTWYESAYKGLITSASLISTTGIEVREGGYAALTLPLVLVIAICGGCGFSTAGGIKLFRVGAMLGQANLELARLIYPHGIRPSRFGMQSFNVQAMKAVWCATMSFLFLIISSALFLSIAGLSFEASLVAAISATSNFGELYTNLSPFDGSWPTYSELPVTGHLILCVTMILGRLEIFAIFILIGMFRIRS